MRPSERPSEGSSIPKSEMSIPMSPTDTQPPDSYSREPKKSFHLLSSKINYFLVTFCIYIKLHLRLSYKLSRIRIILTTALIKEQIVFNFMHICE